MFLSENMLSSVSNSGSRSLIFGLKDFCHSAKGAYGGPVG